jgi:hypothetical protein
MHVFQICIFLAFSFLKLTTRARTFEWKRRYQSKKKRVEKENGGTNDVTKEVSDATTYRVENKVFLNAEQYWDYMYINLDIKMEPNDYVSAEEIEKAKAENEEEFLVFKNKFQQVPQKLPPLHTGSSTHMNHIVESSATDTGVMQIFVKNLDGKTVTLDVKKSDTVRSLKEKMANSEIHLRVRLVGGATGSSITHSSTKKKPRMYDPVKNPLGYLKVEAERTKQSA